MNVRMCQRGEGIIFIFIKKVFKLQSIAGHIGLVAQHLVCTNRI